MFSITKRDIDPILQMSQKLVPDVDFAQVNDWGILFLVCGCFAGQAEREILQKEIIVLMPKSIGESHAVQFAKYIEEWSQNEISVKLARQRIESSDTQAVNSQSHENLISYLSIAIMLNSLTEWNREEFVKLQSWVADSELGWAGMFFAAGFLLSNNSNVKWEAWSSTLLSMSDELKPQLKELFDDYSSPSKLRNAIRTLSKIQKYFQFSPDTLLADFALVGLAFDVLDSVRAVELLAETQLPHRAYPIARTAFEAAQQAMVLATQEDYALAGTRAWIYFCKKDSNWLAQARPKGSGVANKEDAERWFQEKLTEMSIMWEQFSPGKTELIYEAENLLKSQPRRPDNWLGQNMAHLQHNAYRQIADALGSDIKEDSIEMNRAIYSNLSKETHARARLEPVSLELDVNGVLNVEFAARDVEINSKSVSLSAALSAQEAAMSLVYRMKT